MRVLAHLGCLLLFTSFAAAAGNVYKWKDANGVTQYSEKPPVGKAYEAMRIDNRGGAVAEAPQDVAHLPPAEVPERGIRVAGGDEDGMLEVR